MRSSAWIFQCNPDRFDIDGYLAVTRDLLWLVRQHADAMRPNQTVYIWRNAGESKAVPGVIAVGVLTGVPAVRADQPDARPFWKEQAEGQTEERRIGIRILEVATTKSVIKSDWLSDDPVCDDLPNLRMRQQTNYQLSARHAQRLARLWSKTGADFDRADLLLSLRAYADTFGTPVSKLRGTPVSDTALVTGRAVSSIYAKVMNFRAQDPRSPGEGQANAGEPTKQVWAEFWNGTEIDRARLDTAIAAIMTPGAEPASLKEIEAETEAAEGYTAEGRKRLVMHYRLERNRRVVDDAKAAWFASNPLMPCCVCGMSFAERYGAVGERFIEAHHRRQLSELSGPVEPRIEDLAPVCANCHRMLHRGDGITIEGLAAVFA